MTYSDTGSPAVPDCEPALRAGQRFLQVDYDIGLFAGIVDSETHTFHGSLRYLLRACMQPTHYRYRSQDRSRGRRRNRASGENPPSRTIACHWAFGRRKSPKGFLLQKVDAGIWMVIRGWIAPRRSRPAATARSLPAERHFAGPGRLQGPCRRTTTS
jgi:hypothetical protein